MYSVLFYQAFMRRTVYLIAIIIFLTGSVPQVAFCENTTMYALYVQWGRDAISEKDYDGAIDLFEYAYTLKPSEEVTSYINLIKRIKENRVDSLTGLEKEIYDSIELKDKPSGTILERVRAYKPQTDLTVQEQDKVIPKKEESLKSIPDKQVKAPTSYRKENTSPDERPEKIFVPQRDSLTLVEDQTVYLNNELKSSQPQTVLRIPLNTNVILEGSNIDRFLVVSPGYINISKIDRDHILISAVQRGITLLHVWDDTMRWTFKIEVTLPKLIAPAMVVSKYDQYNARPFSITYFNDWNQDRKSVV